MLSCDSYVGSACIYGSCPLTPFDIYSVSSSPLPCDCLDCGFNLGCTDCIKLNTSYCPDFVGDFE